MTKQENRSRCIRLSEKELTLTAVQTDGNILFRNQSAYAIDDFYAHLCSLLWRSLK